MQSTNFHNIYCQSFSSYFWRSCLTSHYQWRTGKYCINSLTACKKFTILFDIDIFLQCLQDKIPSALLSRWRIIDTWDQWFIISDSHPFDLVGTLWNWTSLTSYVFKITRSWRNSRGTDGWGIWWGIRRDRRRDITSVQYSSPSVDGDTEETEFTFRATRNGDSCNVFHCTGTQNGVNWSTANRYKCRIFSLFNLYSFLGGEAGFSNCSKWNKRLHPSIHVIQKYRKLLTQPSDIRITEMYIPF